jgi:spermidine synthase
VIHEAETEYQYARVIERPDGVRLLELNEGQAEHSHYDPRSVLTGDYWDTHLVLPFAALRAPPARVALLGNAAGTIARAYGRFFPGARVDGVEIDPTLSEIGRRYFHMRNPRLHVFSEDARPFLRRTQTRYDVISLDVYRQPYIPFYLTPREVFELARDRLAPGGVLVVNVGHPKGEAGLEKVLAATIGTAFRHVLRDPSETTNTQLVAARGPLSAERLRRMALRLPAGLRPIAAAAAQRLAPPLRGGSVYTDDRAPVEWLIDRSIVDYAAGG